MDQQTVEQYLDNCAKELNTKTQDFSLLPSFKKLSKKTPSFKKGFVLKLLNYSTLLPNETSQKIKIIMLTLEGLMSKNLMYSQEDWVKLMKAFEDTAQNSNLNIDDLPLDHAIDQIKRYIQKNELTRMLKFFIQKMLTWNYSVKSGPAIINKLKYQMLDALEETILASELYNAPDFEALMHLAHKATQGKPTAKFQKQAKEHIETLGKENTEKQPMKY